MSATVLPPEIAPPMTINSCPSCSHWLPDGTLACPDCQALTYAQYLAGISSSAQRLEQEGKLAEARDMWQHTLQYLPPETRQIAMVQEHIAQIDARLKTTQDTEAKWKKRLGPLAPVALFLIKAKTWLFLAFKWKFLLSGLMYFGVYWALYGWQFALGFSAGIFIHEMGHYIAARSRGLKVDLPMFLPGFGAYVRWYDTGVSREDLASIALAGPFAGFLSAAACYGLFFVWHYPLLLVLANVGAWLNLLNLFPIAFPFAMDGAQAVYALSRAQRIMVATTCIALFAVTAQGAHDGDLVGPHTVWTFLIVGVGMAWKCLANDTPPKAGTRSFAYFQALVLALGFLILLTPNVH